MTNNTNAPTEWVTVPRVAEGYRLIAVNAEFDVLMYCLDRYESNGRLDNCSDLIEPFAAFDWRPVEAAPPAPEAGARRPLTDEQVFSDVDIMAANARIGARMSDIMRIARAIESAHGIGGPAGANTTGGA